MISSLTVKLSIIFWIFKLECIQSFLFLIFFLLLWRTEKYNEVSLCRFVTPIKMPKPHQSSYIRTFVCYSIAFHKSFLIHNWNVSFESEMISEQFCCVVRTCSTNDCYDKYRQWQTTWRKITANQIQLQWNEKRITFKFPNDTFQSSFDSIDLNFCFIFILSCYCT